MALLLALLLALLPSLERTVSGLDTAPFLFQVLAERPHQADSAAAHLRRHQPELVQRQRGRTSGRLWTSGSLQTQQQVLQQVSTLTL